MADEQQYLRYFQHNHIRQEGPRAVAGLFCDLAYQMAMYLSDDTEEQWGRGMQHLLDARDHMIRVAAANRSR